MRAIKFRAWDNARGRWANPKDLQSELGFNREILYWSAKDGMLSLKNHDDYIWLQHTGIKERTAGKSSKAQSLAGQAPGGC